MGPLPLIAAKHQSAGPENVLPQWQQKIAYAENKEGRCSDQALDPLIFCTKCNFLQVLDLHIFLQKQTGHWGRGCLHFHLLLYPLLVCRMAMGTKKCRNSHQRIAAGCPTETRTQSNRTKIWCATITPWGNRF